jgi:hypothetical protein
MLLCPRQRHGNAVCVAVYRMNITQSRGLDTTALMQPSMPAGPELVQEAAIYQCSQTCTSCLSLWNGIEWDTARGREMR